MNTPEPWYITDPTADDEPTPQDLFRHAVSKCLDGIHSVHPTDGEPHFSWQKCDSCGTYLGGDRHAAAGILEVGNAVIPLEICTDCLVFHANGDEPESWRAHSD